jgi:hypothetical protein
MSLRHATLAVQSQQSETTEEQPVTTLAEIIKTGAPISTSPGEQVELSLIAATHLLAAIDTDRAAMGLFGAPDAWDWDLAAEDADPEAPIVTAHGLRYIIDATATGSPELHRLCTAHPSCTNDALSYEALVTAVCLEHLDTPGEITKAHAEMGSPRSLRLDTWESHVTRDMRTLEGDLRVIAEHR